MSTTYLQSKINHLESVHVTRVIAHASGPPKPGGIYFDGSLSVELRSADGVFVFGVQKCHLAGRRLFAAHTADRDFVLDLSLVVLHSGVNVDVLDEDSWFGVQQDWSVKYEEKLKFALEFQDYPRKIFQTYVCRRS